MENVDRCWRQVPESRSKDSFFGQEVLLVPENLTLFRVRKFPLSSVKHSELAEAVHLDIDLWSPWEEPQEFYYWPVRSGGQWVVAIWIWQTLALQNLVELEDITPTHTMPEQAWKIAAIDCKEFPAIYIDQIEPGKWSYSVLDSSGIPLYLSLVVNKAAAQRFWHFLDEESRHYPVIIDEGVDQASWLEDGLEDVRKVGRNLPVAPSLHYARKPGVKDWSDAFTWLKPVGAILVLYLIWISGNGLVLLKQSQFVAGQVATARDAASEVLDQRVEVERIYAKLEHMQKIRAEQTQFERMLAALSEKLPKDAWLEFIEYNNADGGWVDILGNAKQSVGLAAVLEEMPEVQHAMFLNDIRKDQRTGLEPFKIRLKLTDKE
ncbi:MAG: hypothetical protein K9K86_00490 [Pseudomonadales bacterium]|nr:hypothetical protein [Pseudomonadales bacterium]